MVSSRLDEASVRRGLNPSRPASPLHLFDFWQVRTSLKPLNFILSSFFPFSFALVPFSFLSLIIHDSTALNFLILHTQFYITFSVSSSF